MLRNLIHMLSIFSLVVALVAMGVPSQGRGCTQMAKAEVCIDPALRVGADTKGDHLSKKCMDSIAADEVGMVDAQTLRDMACAREVLTASGHFAAMPWKPPRRLV